MRLTIVRDGTVASVVPITSDEQTVPFSTPIGMGGFVRVEVRGQPAFGGSAAPLASRTDMEALSNPLFLTLGAPPAGTTPDRTQPPAKAGPRRVRAAPVRPAGAGPRTADPITSKAGPASTSPSPGNRLAATGPTELLPVLALATAATGAAAHRLSHSELRFRAAVGDTLTGALLAVDGEVTAVESGAFTLSRWRSGCCSTDHPVDVRVHAAEHGLRLGDWCQVKGTWVVGTGHDGAAPELTAQRWQRIDAHPDRREGTT